MPSLGLIDRNAKDFEGLGGLDPLLPTAQGPGRLPAVLLATISVTVDIYILVCIYNMAFSLTNKHKA